MPRSGLHVPLDVNFQDDSKVLRVSLEAELVYLRSLALAKRLDEEGALDHAHLHRLSEKMDDHPDVLAKELVDVGLWIETDNGWAIAAWAAHNMLTDERSEARAAEAERKRLWRERKKASGGTATPVPPGQENVSPVAPTSEVKESTSEVKQQQGTRRDTVEAVAALIAERQGKPAEAATKKNQGAWLAAAVRGIADEIAERCYALIVANPGWTPLELADALEPPKRGPLCGVCMTENPTYCGEDCPLPPPKEGELVDNVVGIGSAKKAIAPLSRPNQNYPEGYANDVR